MKTSNKKVYTTLSLFRRVMNYDGIYRGENTVEGDKNGGLLFFVFIRRNLEHIELKWLWSSDVTYDTI